MSIELEQLLFGYSYGHSLLAASTRLPRSVIFKLGEFTDLSGPSYVPGFESYYSGIYVAEMDFYVLCKTWIAPEYRVGSVWSHCIVIKRSQFSQIQNLGDLRSCFIKPEQNSYESFNNKILFEEKGPSTHRIPISNLELYENLLSIYYGFPDYTIVFPTKNATMYEDLVFDFWTGQPYPIKTSLCFSTGSLAERSLGLKFDIEIIPVENTKQINHMRRAATFQELLAESHFKHPANYGEKLDNFVGTFDKSIVKKAIEGPGHNPRIEISTLFEIEYLAEINSNQWELANKIATLIEARSSDRGNLKELEYSIFGYNLGQFVNLPESVKLFGLLSTESINKQSIDRLNALPRFFKLVEESPDDGLELIERLQNSRLNPIASQILGEFPKQFDFLHLLSPNSTYTFSHLTRLFKLFPEVVLDSELWKKGLGHEDTLVRILNSMRLPKDDLSLALLRIIHNNLTSYSKHLAEYLVDAVITAILDELSNAEKMASERKILSSATLTAWDQYCKTWFSKSEIYGFRITQLVQNSDSQSAFRTALLLRYLIISNKSIQSLSYSVIHVWSDKFKQLPKELKYILETVILLFSLEENESKSANLIANVFPDIFTGLSDGDFPKYLRDFIESNINIYQRIESGRIESQLCAIISAKFAKHDWPTTIFTELFTRNDIKDELITSLPRGLFNHRYYDKVINQTRSKTHGQDQT